MLVLSRHREETIRIGDDVKVLVVDIRGDKVRLGIEAPHDVPVHREEVYQAILETRPSRIVDARKLEAARKKIAQVQVTEKAFLGVPLECFTKDELVRILSMVP